MFGSLGGAELLLILVLALLLFGPRKLPEIGRTLGRGLSEFRKATTEFKSNLEREVDLDQLRQTRDSLQDAGQDLRDSLAEAREIGAARGTVPRRPDGPGAENGQEKPASSAGERGGPSTPSDAAEDRQT